MRITASVILYLIVAIGLPTACESAPRVQSKAAAPAQSDLDKLLAPVALYPDQLLAQMLLCARDPGQVVQLKAFLDKNSTLKGTQLQDAATAAGLGPSFVALTLFPPVVEQMAKDVDWTTALGQAFNTDQKAVFASIQRLRAEAQKAGNLKDTPQQNVEMKTTSSGDTVIIIEPANPQVVYVPQYNPQVVYVEQDDHSDAVAAGLIGFTAGIAIGAAFDNDYYYGPYGYHGGFHMYNDAWDDWYDHREDAREDWADHREDVMENRTDRSETRQEQRTDRVESRDGSNRAATPEQRTERQQNRQETGTSGRTATQAADRSASPAARGYSGDSGTRTTSRDTSGTRSDAFSGYSSGSSQRAASSRGSSSRSSGGGGGRSRSGGGRR